MPDLKFEQITPHIFKLDLPLFGRRLMVGVWLVQHSSGWMVVDAGFAGVEELIVNQILAFTGGKPPTRLILTHGHGDHGGAAEAMVDRWGLAGCGGPRRDSIHPRPRAVSPHRAELVGLSPLAIVRPVAHRAQCAVAAG
ncbi:MAG: MBL fold metallo-hydrolase [Chloroflexi bacterium]|nr:MBL fold metallo-hydrolase [Chloroflexota bacterium]